MFIPKKGNRLFSNDVVAKKDEDGHVIIGPRNFTTRPVKMGGHKDWQVFSKPEYVSIGDVYKPAQGNVSRGNAKDGYLKAGHEKNFVPAQNVAFKNHAPYPHMSDHTEVKKNFRDEEGHVKIHPKNMVLSMGKKAQSFTAFPEHRKDEYEYGKIINRKELEDHWSKLQEKPFSQKVRLQATFNKPMAVYGEDVPIKARPASGKTQQKYAEHERAWRPSMPPRSGVYCTIAKHPEFMPNPPKQLTRVKPVEGEPEAPPPFKMTHKRKTVPTTSVATNFRNLKASYPSIFRK